MQGWNAGGFFGNKDRLQTYWARKGRRTCFTSVWMFPLSLKSAKEQQSARCCRMGKGHSWTAPGLSVSAL